MIKDIYNYRNFITDDLHPSGNVWCFQATRIIPIGAVLEMEEAVETFVASWQSHGTPIISFTKIFYGQFLVFYAENTSGCSIDKLFHFVKEQSQKYDLALLNRTLQAFWVNEKIQIIPFNQISHALRLQKISLDTLYVDNSISTLKEFKDNWILPIRKSWLMEAIND